MKNECLPNLRNCVGNFASSPEDTKVKFSTVLLSFAPLLDEAALGSSEYRDLTDFVLSIYSKKFDKVVALVGENCATNKKMVQSFALAVNIYFASHRKLLQKTS